MSDSSKIDLTARHHGDGYGDGDGDGDGSGHGYGYGDGYGDGSGSGYWKIIAAKAIAAFQSHIGFLAFWKSSKDGLPSNGGSQNEPAHPGLVQEISGPLALCGPKSLHATLNPDKWTGERLWLVALHGEVHFQQDKCGALKREILVEIAPKPK